MEQSAFYSIQRYVSPQLCSAELSVSPSFYSVLYLVFDAESCFTRNLDLSFVIHLVPSSK